GAQRTLCGELALAREGPGSVGSGPLRHPSPAAARVGEERGMTSPVRRLAELRRITGTWLFVVAFAARLPVAMNVVGVLTLVTVVRDSVGDGGFVSAALGIAS